MRILHTSDWHLGHKLYDRSRLIEHERCLNWLLSVLQEEQVDILLVAGDVFDTALPSAAATDLYYRFLHRLYTKTEVITLITAGNHDSGVRLAASREFLRLGRAHVVGRLPESVTDCVVTVEGVAVAMVPYLPEGDILSYVSFEEQIEVARRYREATRRIFQICVDAMPSEAYKILMGHLFLHGGSVSDSERPIQIGGTMPVMQSDIPDGVDYVALGHLHRPQEVSHPQTQIRYSGSILPMTFREAEHAKQMVLIDTETNSVDSLPVPSFQKMARVSGTYEEVMQRAASEDWSEHALEVQLHLTEAGASAADNVRSAFAQRGGDVFVVETFRETSSEYTRPSAEEVRTLSPEEIFTAFYQHHFPEGTQLEQIKESFTELVQMTVAQRIGDGS